MPSAYPPDAFAPTGDLWWTLKTWPGKRMRFGAEVKIASWLQFNADVGSLHTLRDLRRVLGEKGKPEAQEHFNRRVRKLRDFGWEILSARDDASLQPDQYRLQKKGDPIWLGKSRFAQPQPSAAVRREVFDRDGRRCVLCGIGAGEEYPNRPGRHARLTLGHVVANLRGGATTADNLRTECSLCNEPVRAEAATVEDLATLLERVKRLGRSDKERLLDWIRAEKRSRDAVDVLFDLIRSLPAAQRDEVRERLGVMVNGADSSSNP